MSAHVEINTLAALTEGTLPEAEAEAVRQHLAECRSCMAAYVDAVRYRAAWLARPDAFAMDDEARTIEMALRSRKGPIEPALRSFRAWPQRAGTLHGLVATVATVLVIALAGIAMVRTPRTTDPRYSLSPTVLEATERSSAHGLVLPGGEAAAAREYPELRSGRSRVSLELQHEVDRAVRSYEDGEQGPDATLRLIAVLLAAGEIDAARDYAREGMRRHPDHVPLMIYAADASYRSNDVRGAEAILRRAAKRNPRDPLVALDLGIVLRQLGREDEARPLFSRAARSRTPGIGARGTRELLQTR